jgi:hypothetical protein
MINKLFCLFIALACGTQCWINVRECPLVINQPYENAIMVLNHGEKTVRQFSLGCIAFDNQNHLKIGDIVKSLDGPILAKDGFWGTQLEAMKEWRSSCGGSHWKIGVVSVLFDDGTSWEISSIKK